MSKNKSDQNAHEEQVFNDVLRLSMASGGYKKKAALKVCGSINAGSECPEYCYYPRKWIHCWFGAF